MADRPYTDADRKLVASAIWNSTPIETSTDLDHVTRRVLDALTAAGWTPAQQPAAPADSHVDGSDGPGWDRDTIEAIAAWLDGEDEPAPECTGDQLRALLADRDHAYAEMDNLGQWLSLREGELASANSQRDEARRAAIGLAAGLEAARRDAAVDALDWAVSEYERRCEWPGMTELAAWAAEVRAGRTIPPADRT